MKMIWKYVRPYRWFILSVMLIKLLGTGSDLLMPYVLEHLLDHVIPAASDAWPVIAWGCVMLLLTLITRVLNVTANRMSVKVARNSTYAVRRDLFHTALNLSGNQMDAPDFVDIPRIPVGSKGKITVQLTAPEEPGEYRSEWKLFGSDNRFFGESLVVNITVQ